MAQGPRAKGLPVVAGYVLWIMAHNARDVPSSRGEPARLYFRGWEHLARVLGYPPGDPAGKLAVKRAIAELRTRGLIEPVSRRGERGNRVYRLHIVPT